MGGGGGASASILLRGEGRVITNNGEGVLRRKNLQISDLQRLQSYRVTTKVTAEGNRVTRKQGITEEQGNRVTS